MTHAATTAPRHSSSVSATRVSKHISTAIVSAATPAAKGTNSLAPYPTLRSSSSSPALSRLRPRRMPPSWSAPVPPSTPVDASPPTAARSEPEVSRDLEVVPAVGVHEFSPRRRRRVRGGDGGGGGGVGCGSVALDASALRRYPRVVAAPTASDCASLRSRARPPIATTPRWTVQRADGRDEKEGERDVRDDPEVKR